MTIATVQLIMGGLGILTGLLIALFGPGRRWIRWLLAIATGAGVAITGWPKLWLVESSPQFQLHQSLLFASVVVLVSLLTIMLLYPSRGTKRRNQDEAARLASLSTAQSEVHGATDSAVTTSPEMALEELTDAQEPGRDPIALQLDKSPTAMIANQEEHALMHLLPTAKQPSTSNNLTDSTEASEATETNNVNDADASEPLLVETTSNAPSIDEVIEKQIDKPVNDQDAAGSADVVSLDERRTKREGEVAADSLDLSDSEELYQAMRDAEAELELPEDSTWLDDDVDTELEARPADYQRSNAMQAAMNEDIEDAEILAINDSMDTDAATADLPVSEDYEINSDLTEIDLAADELAASDAESVDVALEAAESRDASYEVSQDNRPPLAAPAPTLEAALTAQRHSIAQLSSDTDTLANRLQEWRKLSDEQEQTAWQSSLRQGQTVQHQQQRILAENNFRSAAVDLIRTQRDVMRQLMTQIGTLGEQREEDLASMTALQETSVNQQRLARQAALLARKAAADKQTLMNTLRQEQTAHARTKSAAKRAMDIARDAVDKLAGHERRLGYTSDRKNPDTQG